MNDSNQRIPMPWNQRWEQFRWRILPVLSFIATIVACGWLWRRQVELMPFAVGEVHSQSVDVRSPAAGRLLPLEGTDGSGWQLFAPVKAGEVAARVKPSDQADAVEVAAPLEGVVMSVVAQPGQAVNRGDPLLRIASTTPEYIVCHVPERWQNEMAPGRAVAMRQRDTGAPWLLSKIEAVGATIELTPVHQLKDSNIQTRGFPVRISLPEKLNLKPGSLVEVRFARASGG